MQEDHAVIADEVRALERLDLEGLRAAWALRFGLPPKIRSQDLLRLSLAWRIQANALGGLDAATRRRLRRGGGVGTTDHVSDGVCITREWRGGTYKVYRAEGAYRWEGRPYASLSAVAEAITGVKRNGPKFFGLRPEAIE